MKHFPTIFLACALSSSVLIAQAPLPDEFQSSFNKPLRAVRNNPEKFPDQKITGRIAMPWSDDSSWCDLEVDYSQLTENPGEGEVSQRVVVKRLPKGSRAQFGLQEFPLQPEKEIAIRFLAKSPDYTPVTLNIAQSKPPYHSYFAQRIQPSAEWQEFEILVPAGFDDPAARLHFLIEQTGTFDLDHFRFERRKSTTAQISEERQANLLPSGAFPLGAAPPWIAHGFARREVGELRGPTGFPALQLQVRQQPGFARFEQSLKVAFRAVPGKPVTLRVSANLLEGQADIALRAGVEKIWEAPFGTTFPLQPGWKTYKHTIELPPSPRGYYLAQIAFEGSARVAIDRVQLSQEGEAFSLSGPLELAIEADKPFGLFGEQEDFSFSLAAWGDLAAAREIRISLNDIHGTSREIGRYPMPSVPFDPVNTTFPMPEGLAPFGSFRLEARAFSADGEAVGQPAELLLHRVRTPRFGQETAPDSPFGIHYGTTHLDSVGLDVVKKLGFNWLRLFKTFSWKRIEARQGELDFSQSDQDVELLAAHNLLALGVLGDGAPAWAAKNRDPEFKGWACWTPRDPVEFADFTAKVFERYGDRVTAYEPWNEPYYPGFFTERIEDGQRIIGSAEDYLTIQKLVFESARASGKPVQIGWNTNSLEEMPRNLELIKLGILPFTDFVALHHYLGQPDPAPELIRQVESMRESMGDVERPIWNTEGGLGPFTAFNFYKNMPPFQTDHHAMNWAEWYVRYYLACLSSGVKRYFAYLFGAPNFWTPDYHFNNVDGRLGPNLTAMSALAWQVDGTNFVRTVVYTDGTRMQIFEGSGRAVACVLPHPASRRRIPTDPAIKAFDLFGNELAPGAAAPEQLHYLQIDDTAARLADVLAP